MFPRRIFETLKEGMGKLHVRVKVKLKILDSDTIEGVVASVERVKIGDMRFDGLGIRPSKKGFQYYYRAPDIREIYVCEGGKERLLYRRS